MTGWRYVGAVGEPQFESGFHNAAIEPPVAHLHFPRLWAERNDERVVTFANGHVYDRAERRKGLRALIGMMRRERAA